MNLSLQKRRSQVFASLAGFLCCCAIILLSSCAKKSVESPLIGTWQVQGEKSTIEFKTDGTVAGSDEGEAQTGTYKFTDATHMKMEVNLTKRDLPPGAKMPDSLAIECEMKVQDKDNIDLEMTMSFPGDSSKTHTQTAHLKRIK